MRRLTLLELEEAAYTYAAPLLAFHRVETRRARLKRRTDCGHVIDGSEPYRYQVWKVPGTAGVGQRTDCEFCSRRDLRS